MRLLLEGYRVSRHTSNATPTLFLFIINHIATFARRGSDTWCYSSLSFFCVYFFLSLSSIYVFSLQRPDTPPIHYVLSLTSTSFCFISLLLLWMVFSPQRRNIPSVHYLLFLINTPSCFISILTLKEVRDTGGQITKMKTTCAEPFLGRARGENEKRALAYPESKEKSIAAEMWYALRYLKHNLEIPRALR